MRERWQQARVAVDGTHHVIGAAPIYARRFRTVLSFHPPGLAAVFDNDGAFHIDMTGAPVYAGKFDEVAGFYEGLAAVRTGETWQHILPDGSAAYERGNLWCGNFQSGRAVVRSAEGYFHILPNGEPLYSEPHRYVGDYRDRRAVARMQDGLCAHIDEDGKMAHGSRFLDLDVYHKGYARARDSRGWLHIDVAGEPVYDCRFAMVEPFYNGIALVHTLSGDICRITPDGKIVETIQTQAE